MTHPAINQARRILRWALVPDGDPASLAVIAAGRDGDVGRALAALDGAREQLGALGEMVDALRGQVEAEREAQAA